MTHRAKAAVPPSGRIISELD